MNTSSEAGPQGRDAAERAERHMPLSWLLVVWAALMALTAATVCAGRLDLGLFNVWIALGIATVKAALVLAVFMHLLYDRPVHLIVLCAALIFVLLFIGVVLMDVRLYRPEAIPDYAPAMQR